MAAGKGKMSAIRALVKFLIALALALAIYFAYPGVADYLGIDGGRASGHTVIPVGEGEYIELHFIDVGQGDSILIRTAGGNILIDAGPGSAEEELKYYLSDLDISTLEYAVFTHPHEDHIGGADMIMTDFTVSNVILPAAETETKTYARMMEAIEGSGATLITAVSGSEYTLGSMTMTLLAPNAEKYSNLNNYSVALRLAFGGTSFILTGDAEALSEGEILENFDAAFLNCDLYKVGHHGSETSSSQAFLEVIVPKISVISCGAGNSYGHPHAITLDKLEKIGSEVYRTDLLGSIVFRSDGSEITLMSKK